MINPSAATVEGSHDPSVQAGGFIISTFIKHLGLGHCSYKLCKSPPGLRRPFSPRRVATPATPRPAPTGLGRAAMLPEQGPWGYKGSSPGRENEGEQEAGWAGTHLVLEWWPERGSSTAWRVCGWWALKSCSDPGWCSQPRSAHRARPSRRRPKAAGGRAPTSRPHCRSSA